MNKELKAVQTPGARCRLYRKRANMTQEKLAEKIHCSVDLISAIERGSRTLTNENAAAMASVFGVRKECLLCFDDIETDFEKRLIPFVEKAVARKAEKDAFLLYAGLYGYNVVDAYNPKFEKYECMAIDDFVELDEQEQQSLIMNIFNTPNLHYYSFQNGEGVEFGRCTEEEFNTMVKEISEFAEFKIRKVCEGVIKNAVDSGKAD